MIRERKHVYMEAFLDVLTGKASSSEEDKEEEDVSGEFVRVVLDLLTFRRSSIRRLALTLLESLHTSIPAVYDEESKERKYELEKERSRLCTSLERLSVEAVSFSRISKCSSQNPPCRVRRKSSCRKLF